jgi:hypothetical protein
LIFLLASVVLYSAFPGFFVAYTVYYFSFISNASDQILNWEMDYWNWASV